MPFEDISYLELWQPFCSAEQNHNYIDGRPQNEVQVGPDKLEVVASFCYLGDILSAGRGCEITLHM